MSLAFAKGAHLATGIRILGIPSLLGWAEALGSLPEHSQVVVWLDGRKGLAFRARYRRSGQGWAQETKPALIPLEKALEELKGGEILTGDVPESRPADSRFAGLAWAPQERRRTSAAAIGRLAWPRLERGESDDPETIEPLYLRLSEAEILWQTRAASPR